MAADKVVLVEVQYDTDTAIKNLNKLSDEIAENEKQQKSLKDAYKDGTITHEQYGQALAENQETIKKGKSERNNLIKQIQAEEGSVTKLKAQIKQLEQERDKLNQNTKEGRVQAQELNEKLVNMKGALKEARTGTKQTGGALGRLKGDLNNLPGPLGNIAQGFGGMTKAAIRFILTPIGAIITAIVVVIKALVDAFKRSEDRMNRTRVLTDKLAGVYKGLQKVLEPVVDFIVDNVVKAFDAMGNAVDKALGFISKGLRRLGLEKAADGFDNFTTSISKTVKAAGELSQMEAQLTKELRNQEKTQLEFQKLAEVQRQLRDDESKNIEERIKANQKLGDILQTQLKEELRIANLALAVAKKRIEVEGETPEALNERGEALTKIAEIEERITGQESEQLVNINSLLKERNELEKIRLENAEARQKAYEKILEQNDQFLEDLDAEIEKEINIDELTTEMHEKRLEEIEAERLAHIEAERQKLESTLQAIDEIGIASGALKDERIANQTALLNAAVSLNKLQEASEREKYDLIKEFAMGLTSFINQGHEMELSNLESQKQAELLLVGDNTEARERIERDYANKAAELKEKQFNEDKTKALIDTAIATATAVVKALPNVPLSIAIGATGLIQEGIIANKRFNAQTYAKGGKLALFGGRSHKEGGTHLFGTDGSHLEVEKNEAAFVLNKNATAEISALSAINESFGGRSFGTKSAHLQDGGQAQGVQSITPEDLANALRDVTIITKVSDIKTGMSKFDKVINNSVV